MRQTRPSRKALVLGPRAIAAIIARQLEAKGFEAVLQEDLDPTLPMSGGNDGLDLLRKLLARFAASADPASGFAACLHPGVTAWAEQPELPILAQEAGLQAICPPTHALALFANKLNLLNNAEALGIPNLAIAFDPLYCVREIQELMVRSHHQFPIVLKSARGGGCSSVFVAYEPQDMGRKLALWIEQLRRANGEVILFAERYLEGARRVMVPFARHLDGSIETFPSVDTSLQCRQRKVIEICPATSLQTGIDAASEDLLREWTCKLAEDCRFVGVGTLEFLVDSSRAYLIDGCARLNTGFHLWEQVAGTSAVAWQLSTIEGGRSTEAPELRPVKSWTSGVALRVLAEDSLLQLPQPGKIREMSSAREWDFGTSQAEFHASFEEGSEVLPSGHGLIGMVFAGARESKHAMTLALGILNELWIAGSLHTNERFLSELLSHPWVREGVFHAGFIDEEFIPAVRPSAELAQLFGSLCQAHPRVTEASAAAPNETVRWAAGDQWVSPQPEAIRWQGTPGFWEENDLAGVSGQVELRDGSRHRVCAYPMTSLPDARWQVRIGQWVLSVRRVLTNRNAKKGTASKRQLKAKALVAGKVHSILYREGALIPAHEPFLIVECLGTLVPHAAPAEFRLLRWRVRAEEPVTGGQELAEIENPA